MKLIYSSNSKKFHPDLKSCNFCTTIHLLKLFYNFYDFCHRVCVRFFTQKCDKWSGKRVVIISAKANFPQKTLIVYQESKWEAKQSKGGQIYRKKGWRSTTISFLMKCSGPLPINTYGHFISFAAARNLFKTVSTLFKMK